MPADRPTRDKVSDALYKCGIRRSGYGADELTGMDCDRLADAVIALITESRPKPLWEGETNEAAVLTTRYSLIPCVEVPPGTRVAVTAVEPTDSTQETDRG